MDRYVVISSDCHTVGRPEDYTPYFEAKHLDFCAAVPGRRAGVALTQIYDIDIAVATIEAAAAAGLKGVSVPILFDDPNAPALYHPRYEPIWAACAASDMPVHIHGGPGPDYG